MRCGRSVREQVFVGKDESSLELAGTLLLATNKWQLFGTALRLGSEHLYGHLKIIFEGDEEILFGETT